MCFRRLRQKNLSIMLILILTFQIFFVMTISPTVHGWTFWKYETDGSVVSVGVSADGNYTVAGTDNGNLYLLDSNGSLRWQKNFPVDVECVAISGDGSRIVAGVHEYRSGYPDIYLYDNLGGTIWQRDLVQGSWPNDVAISPDATHIVTGDQLNLTYFYDISGSLLWTHTAGYWISAVSTSSGGEYTAVGSWDDNLYFFDKSGNLLWSKPFEYNVEAVSVSPEGQYVAAGCPTIDDLSLFANNGTLLLEAPFYISIDAVSVSANANRMVVADYEKIAVIDKTANIICTHEKEGYATYIDVAITADGKYIAFGYGDYIYFYDALPSSTLTCELSSSEIAFSDSITVSGIATPPHTGAEVTLTYTRPNGSILTRTTTMDQFGSYSDTFTPGILGEWTVQASWMGDEQYAGSESPLKSFTVGKTEIKYDIPAAIFLGDSLVVSGSISPPLSGVEIRLEYRLVLRDSTWKEEGFINVTRTVITSTDGSFADTFIPSDAGRWELNASWAGNAEHMPSNTEVSFAVNAASQISLLSATPVTLYWRRDQWYCEHGDLRSQLLNMEMPTSSESETVAFDPDDYWWIGHGHYSFEGIHTGALSESVLIEAGLWNLSIWAAARGPNQHFLVSLYYWDENHEANFIASWTTEYFNSTSPDVPTQLTHSFNLPATIIPEGSCLGFVIYDCAYSDVEWFFDSTLHPSHLTIPASTEVVNYTLNITPATGGNTNPASGTYTYVGGTEVTVTAISQTGYAFDHWILDGANAGTTNPISVTMNSNHTLQATFSVSTISLTVVAGTGGTVSPSGTQTLTIGQTYQFNANPNSGYGFDHWDLSGQNKGSTSPLMLTVTTAMAGQTLTALFTVLPTPTPTPTSTPTPTPPPTSTTPTPTPTPTDHATPTPTPTPTTTPTPTSSSSTSPSPPPSTQGLALPMEAIYAAIGIIVIVVIVVAVVVFKKRQKGASKAPTPPPPPPPPTEAEVPQRLETSTLTSVNHIFISHVEEDAEMASEIAQGLEKAGYKAWYYERDSVGGLSYLLQTMKAIEHSQAVILLISPNSLSSNQVTKEVVRTHEAGKPFIPLLYGITHVEFQQRQPEWREAIGSATSVVIPKQGVSKILPRVTDGLASLGVKKSDEFKENPV